VTASPAQRGIYRRLARHSLAHWPLLAVGVAAIVYAVGAHARLVVLKEEERLIMLFYLCSF